MSKLPVYNYLCQVLGNAEIFDSMVLSMFNEIDKDKNNSLEADEVREFFMQLFPDSKHLNTVALDNLFKEIDADGSNSIDVKEFGRFVRVLFEQQKQMLEVVISGEINKKPK